MLAPRCDRFAGRQTGPRAEVEAAQPGIAEGSLQIRSAECSYTQESLEINFLVHCMHLVVTAREQTIEIKGFREIKG